MPAFLRSIAWLLCVVYSTIPAYWLIIHPFAGYWRSRSRSPFRVLLPVWMGMWVFVALITLPWRHVAFYEGPASWIPAALLFAAGIWIYAQSGNQFTARQLGGLPEIEPERHVQRLVTTGIRSRVRHPVYLAHLCEMLGWSIGTGLAVCYVLSALAIVTGAIMLNKEEAELVERFGEEYRQYQARVPPLLPRI